MNEPIDEQSRQLLRELHEYLDLMERRVHRVDDSQKKSNLIGGILALRNTVTKSLSERTIPFHRDKP